jgi:hypothetical protein
MDKRKQEELKARFRAFRDQYLTDPPAEPSAQLTYGGQPHNTQTIGVLVKDPRFGGKFIGRLGMSDYGETVNVRLPSGKMKRVIVGDIMGLIFRENTRYKPDEKDPAFIRAEAEAEKEAWEDEKVRKQTGGDEAS